MYWGEIILTKNRTLLLLIMSLLILAMSSVSASDVSDISDNQEIISDQDSISEDIVSESVDLSSADLESTDDADSVSENQILYLKMKPLRILQALKLPVQVWFMAMIIQSL